MRKATSPKVSTAGLPRRASHLPRSLRLASGLRGPLGLACRPALLALAFFAAGLPALASCNGQPVQTAESTSSRAVPVRLARVERRDLEESLTLTGTLKPRAQVQVVAEVGARLLRILKDEGARVGKNEVLALLDDTDYRLAHERARATHELAEANRAHAAVEKERADNLIKTGGITDKEQLAAEMRLRVAEASLAQARAEAAIAEQQHRRSEVRAPFTGRIGRRLADAGSILAAGSPIFTLVDDAVFEFRASAPSENYGKLRLGSPALVTVDALPGLEAEGRLARITPLIEERSRSFEVVVEVPGRKELVGGLFARATIETGHIDGALVVPPSALIREGSRPGEAAAFVVVAGKVEKRALRLGLESPEAIQVTEGLAEGEAVVVDPPATLADGEAVEAQKETGLQPAQR